MSEIIKSALVPYDHEDMLSLVNQVEAYPKFLQWCQRGFVQHRFERGYEAGMLIKIKGIQVEFITRNEIHKEADLIRMDMALVSGPFKSLKGEWRFRQFPQMGSKVELQLRYEIKSQVIGKMFAKGFDQLASRLVSDFVNRAGEVYADR
jgi:ribosome-associated toxin RatA of RatAB toxin-antitoxin module